MTQQARWEDLSPEQQQEAYRQTKAAVYNSIVSSNPDLPQDSVLRILNEVETSWRWAEQSMENATRFDLSSSIDLATMRERSSQTQAKTQAQVEADQRRQDVAAKASDLTAHVEERRLDRWGRSGEGFAQLAQERKQAGPVAVEEVSELSSDAELDAYVSERRASQERAKAPLPLKVLNPITERTEVVQQQHSPMNALSVGPKLYPRQKLE